MKIYLEDQTENPTGNPETPEAPETEESPVVE
jgi:hypothetical protein